MRESFSNAWRLLLLVLVVAGGAWGQSGAVPPCEDCARWNQPQEPFRVYGNTYYVGTHGLSSILITSPAGHILIDGALPESAAQIASHVTALGFRVEDVKWIVNSHVHFDHAGGIAELQKRSGAAVAVSAWSADVLKNGGVAKNDPQFGVIRPIPRAAHVQVVQDGQVLRVGDVALTAHFTPGHTPGGTSWTWQSCESDRCLSIVYADSITAVSADGFRFSDSKGYPGAVKDFEKSFSFLRTASCDILLTPHPEASDLFGRLGRSGMASPGACRELADRGSERLQQRLATEARGK